MISAVSRSIIVLHRKVIRECGYHIEYIIIFDRVETIHTPCICVMLSNRSADIVEVSSLGNVVFGCLF